MSHNLTAEQIVTLLIIGFIGFWLVYGSLESVKAKAFNEGYKRGRASNQYVREIVK
jgi:hypothetical protein